jgi:beta-lactam-binding protein with PASTA domain
MKKTLAPLTAAIVLCAVYSLSWTASEPPRKSVPHVSVQEMSATEAALRHKNFQPSHWRAMVLRH